MRLTAILLLTCAVAACAPSVRPHPATSAGPAAAPSETWVSDRLYLGRAMPGGDTVSEAAWASFLREVVTPRFPDGLTVVRAEGQWRDASGTIIREPGFILEIHHPPSAAADAAVGEIAAEYRRRFRQESVMRVRASAEVQSYEEE